MKHTILTLLNLLLTVTILTSCYGGNDSNNTTRTTTRSYVVDCGAAEQIGHGSCGLTVTSVSILGGGGQ